MHFRRKHRTCGELTCEIPDVHFRTRPRGITAICRTFSPLKRNGNDRILRSKQRDWRLHFLCFYDAIPIFRRRLQWAKLRELNLIVPGYLNVNIETSLCAVLGCVRIKTTTPDLRRTLNWPQFTNTATPRPAWFKVKLGSAFLGCLSRLSPYFGHFSTPQINPVPPTPHLCCKVFALHFKIVLDAKVYSSDIIYLTMKVNCRQWVPTYYIILCYIYIKLGSFTKKNYKK